VTDIELAEQKILIMLYFEYKLRYNELISLKPALQRYHVAIDDDLLPMALASWKDREWVKVYRDEDGLAAKIMPQKAGEVYKTVLEFLGATSLKINTQLMEIISDADPTHDTPMIEGWKWLTLERKVQAKVPQADAERPTAPIVHNNITVSPIFNNNNNLLPTDDAEIKRLEKSGVRAGWFSAWAGWLALVVGVVAAYLAYLQFVKV
jgi:hypothetical protein